MSSSEVLPPTIESLYQLARELDLVPVSAQRVLRLQAITAATCAQNEEGTWFHSSGAQFRVKDYDWTLGLYQGDIDELVSVISRRARPGHFLLTPGSLRECEEILNARSMSPEHTDEASEAAEQARLAARGIPYLAPVGEGRIDDCLTITGLMWGNAVVEAERRRRVLHPKRPPLKITDQAGNYRPESEILREMTRGERKAYQSDKSGNEERAKSIAAEAIRKARESGTEDLWRGNLRAPLRVRVIDQYGRFSRSREIRHRHTLEYVPNTGRYEKNEAGYLKYPPEGHSSRRGEDIDGPVGPEAEAGTARVVPRRYDRHTAEVILCWAQLRTLGRMNLHNQLLDLCHRGDLPEIDLASHAPRADHQGLDRIRRDYGGDYLGLLREISENGSGGLLNGENPAGTATAKRAAAERLRDVCENMVLDAGIRQAMPEWLIRRLADDGLLPPTPLTQAP